MKSRLSPGKKTVRKSCDPAKYLHSLGSQATARNPPLGEPELTANARIVLERRYLWGTKGGMPGETPRQLFERVAHAVAAPEGKCSEGWGAAFFEMMFDRRFMPNTPTLMNAGRKKGQLSACFVLPVDDSLDGIFDSLKAAAKIHQSGGGTGFSFSRLRAKGSSVQSTKGTASGPVSFMRVYDTATETIRQGGARRGANMAILRVDHPDIIEFIGSKLDQKSALNFNISVGATDEFMWSVVQDRSFALRDPRDGRIVQQVRAREVFDQIVDAAWKCGDPGLVFLDRINLFNPTPKLGPMESTNPCGEQPLLPFESCNLGSLNLGRYLTSNGKFDWILFRRDIHLAVRFLDNVVDVNVFPIIESAKITSRNRKIGLGVMGFADLLLRLGVRYGSNDSERIAEEVMSFLDREAKRASVILALERGAFGNWRGSFWDRLGYPPMRNATVSTVAPTGTISIIAGASSGIEPIFAAAYNRNVLEGSQLLEVHPVVAETLHSNAINIAKLSAGEIEKAVRLYFGEAWVTAADIGVEAHSVIQAAFQRHSDSAVSKTVNLPGEGSRDDVNSVFLRSFYRGCKGVTIYRDGSRAEQVLVRSSASTLTPGRCEVC